MAESSVSPSFFQLLRSYVYFPVLPKSFTIPGFGTIHIPSFSVFSEKWNKLSNKTKWSILLGGISIGLLTLYLRRAGGSAGRKSLRARRRPLSEAQTRAVKRRQKHHSINSVCQSIADSTSASVAGSNFRPHGPSASSTSFAGIGDGDPSAAASVLAVNVNPQQLCQMGHECLEQAITYWEDALDLLEYLPGEGGVSAPPALPTAKEAKLAKDLQILVERASAIANELKDNVIKPAEGLQNTRRKSTLVSAASYDRLHQVLETGSSSGFSGVTAFTSQRRLSNSETSDADSFVSAISDGAGRLSTYSSQETLLPDEELNPEQNFTLYKEGLAAIDSVGVEVRKMRTSMLNCSSDREFLAKLSAVRRAFDVLLADQSVRSWFVSMGRQMIGDLMAKSDKDPSGFYTTFDEMIQYVNKPDAFIKTWDELQVRNVKEMNFYDVVLDFIFLDAFDDLSNPPGSVVSIIQNRWLSSGFKESALQTAVFYVLKSKRHSMKHPDGFMAHFYDVSEHVTPFLAWGFLGPDEQLNMLVNHFHDQLLGFIQDVFSFHRIRYITLEEMKVDILKAAQKRIERVLTTLDLNGDDVGSLSPRDSPFFNISISNNPEMLNAMT